MRLGQIDQQVEWLSQGISEGWPFKGQVRKDETDEEALFGVIRTIEQVRRLRREGNQPGKRDFELAVGLVAVLEQVVYFLLPLGDLLAFSVIDVPGNTPVEEQVGQPIEPLGQLLAFLLKIAYAIVVEVLFGFVALAQVVHHLRKKTLGDVDGAQHVTNLVEDHVLLDPYLPIRRARVADNQVDVSPLLEVAGRLAAGYGAGD